MYQNLPTELINEILTFWPLKMAHEYKLCKFLFDLEKEIKEDITIETSCDILTYDKLKKYIYMYNKLVNKNKHFIQITPNSIVLKPFSKVFTRRLYYNKNDSFQSRSIESRKRETTSIMMEYILPILDIAVYNYYICRFDDRIFIYIKEYNRLFPYWKN